MPNIHSLNRSGVVNTLVTIAIVLAVVSLAAAGTLFLIFVLAAAGGGLIGLAVARSRTGLGATEVGERAPDYAGRVGHINLAHIPVMGIGGLGILAMSLFVGLMLPEGRTQLALGLTGAVFGAGAILMWRHFHSGTPFAEHPEETLHLR